jgi:hypothetical protein
MPKCLTTPMAGTPASFGSGLRRWCERRGLGWGKE